MQGTIALALMPRVLKKDTLLTQAGLMVLGSLFIGLMAQISIPLPFTPVPVTGQTLAVALIGAALGARRGAATVALYLAEGAVGFPVLAGGVGGIAHFFGPTGGYLLGFILSAYVTGFFAERGMDRSLKTSWPAFFAGQSVIFLLGVPWLALYVGGLKAALVAGLLPFIPGEIIKTSIAAGALPTAWKWIRSLEN